MVEGTLETVRQEFQKNRPVVFGTPVQKEKLSAPKVSLSKLLTKYADQILVEADGSRQFPIKIHADWEPVIFPGTTLIIMVVGLSALHQPLQKACHRFELAKQLLDLSPDHLITEDDLLHLILNFIKQKQDILQEQKFCIVWNQADNKERQDVAIHLIKRLKDHKIRSVASSFWI